MLVRAQYVSDSLRVIDAMQLLDELSMIYTTCLMCYVTFSYGKSVMYRKMLAGSLIGLSVFITLYYHVSDSKAPAQYQKRRWRSHASDAQPSRRVLQRT